MAGLPAKDSGFGIRDSGFRPGVLLFPASSCHRVFASGSCLRPRGLTLLELMAALVILGLLLTLIRPVLDSLSPAWRLRGAAQQIESLVLWARNAAIARGEAVQVLYDVPQGACWARVGDKTYSYYQLPSGVRFEAVRFGRAAEVTQDVAACGAFSDGTVDGHEVVLRGSARLRARLIFGRLLAEASYEETTGDAF